ncbi:MAG: type II toxin-antitoxin system RelB/DinJ family antitoxin [Coriobacteriales bacterium]|jgi:antitoxin component of RelBE/YafQ-DinJ toxin-antitoxin module|nr:type II toxin-antitoxin system RelB/DinJ family antitoxin [Coriobacteriales bacterium]
MDAMVTARMPQGKKEIGNSVLHSLGTTPSQLINEVYDYVIRNRQLPVLSSSINVGKHNIKEALVFIDSIPLPADKEFSLMNEDQIKQERLIARGLAIEDDFI